MADNSRNAVYIASIDGKDLYLANNFLNKKNIGYKLRRQDGSYNMNKFCNSLDYSLDLIKIRDVFEKVYSHEAKVSPFSFTVGDKEYTNHVVNVTFKYSVKEFNRVGADVYVRNGYCIRDLDLKDCICRNEKGAIIALQTEHDVAKCAPDLPPYIVFVKDNDDLHGHYEFTNGVPTVLTVADIRKWAYKNGFWVDGIHYVRFKRSAGSARVGKCLFINEKLYSRMHTWEKCGLTIREGQRIDLAAWESYISLTSSSIIDTLQINAENILLIDDYDSKFTDTVMATKAIDGHLVTSPETIEISNCIWDGQSLIDKSILGKYEKFGMVLLRNRFFKSCCFNTNIQQWFEDNGITSLDQVCGQTRAKSIADIKLITTKSSIKFVKFGTLDQWLDHLEPTFGIVKHEKKTHFFGGEMVQSHYQLLNTLQASFEETKEILRPSIEYITALRDDPAVLRYHLKFADYRTGNMIGASNKNDVTYALMNLNDDFTKTQVYADFVKTLVRSQCDSLRCGHILVNGNYSTLLGNPLEMLMATIGQFDGTSQLGVGNIHSTRFEYDRDILGSRSPHVTVGNIWLPHNVADERLDKYFNLTPEICCMNSINENTLFRLSGSDFDSDTALLTDNDLMIKIARRNYDKFLVPTSLVKSDKIKRYFTDEQKADLDIKTSVNKIGEIINFSQILNSLLWDNIAHGETLEQNMELYADVSQLDVMSNLEIDKAKKVFEVDNVVELRRLKAKYHLYDDDNREIRPNFFEHLARRKGFYIKGKKNYKVHKTTMDYVQRIVKSSFIRSRKFSNLGSERLSTVLDRSKYNHDSINRRQIDQIIQIVRNMKRENAEVYSKPNEVLNINEKSILSDRITYAAIVELSKLKINYSTAYAIMNMIDNNGDIKDIKNLLFFTLLSIPSNMFFKVFDESQRRIVVIDRDAYTSDCEYYGKKYVHWYKNGECLYEQVPKDKVNKIVNISEIFAKIDEIA